MITDPTENFTRFAQGLTTFQKKLAAHRWGALMGVIFGGYGRCLIPSMPFDKPPDKTLLYSNLCYQT